MKIENTFTVAAPRERVWRFIDSPEQVAVCVPGCESVQTLAEGLYRALIRAKVGPVKTEFTVDITVIGQQPPDFAEYETNGTEGGKASRLKAISRLTLVEVDALTTAVTYTSDVTIVGRLGKYGSGMMQKVADRMGATTVENIRAHLEADTGA